MSLNRQEPGAKGAKGAKGCGETAVHHVSPATRSSKSSSGKGGGFEKSNNKTANPPKLATLANNFGCFSYFQKPTASEKVSHETAVWLLTCFLYRPFCPTGSCQPTAPPSRPRPLLGLRGQAPLQRAGHAAGQGVAGGHGGHVAALALGEGVWDVLFPEVLDVLG